MSAVSTAGKMISADSGFYFTPVNTGQVWISYNLGMETSLGADAHIEIRYGTGSAPANGAAGTGITSSIITYSYSGSGFNDAVNPSGIINGLTLNTQYWFAICVKSTGSISITYDYVNASIAELGGLRGTNGTSGLSGTSGANGSSGTSGVDGTFYGSSGTSGANGSSGTSGVDGGVTMYNSIISPATQSTYPFYKTNYPVSTFSLSTWTTTNGATYFTMMNLSPGEVINEVAFYMAAASLTSATVSVGLYTTTTDSAGRLYPNILASIS